MVGLSSVLTALKHHKRVLLANKEALVAGGHLVMEAAAREGENFLLPVDSEHSAIFQCLQGAAGNPVRSIALTCSGGPFRTWEKDAIRAATVSASGPNTHSQKRRSSGISSIGMGSTRPASFGRNILTCSNSFSRLRLAVSATTSKRSSCSFATSHACVPMLPVEPKIARRRFFMRSFSLLLMKKPASEGRFEWLDEA